MKRIAFTGHRPNKLYGYDMDNKYYDKLKIILKDMLKYEICEYDADTFITGGALGFDTLAFDVVKDLIDDYGGNHILAIPFEKQPIKWPIESQVKYKIIKQFSACIYVDNYEEYNIKGVRTGEYHPAKLQKRNEWMVDNCDLLIGCWDGVKKGGTWNCLRYAKNLEKEIKIINPKNFEICRLKDIG